MHRSVRYTHFDMEKRYVPFARCTIVRRYGSTIEAASRLTPWGSALARRPGDRAVYAFEKLVRRKRLDEKAGHPGLAGALGCQLSGVSGDDDGGNSVARRREIFV